MMATAPGLTAPTLVSSAVTKNITHGIAAVRPRTRSDGLADEPVDRAVVLCDREQVGDADQRDEQVTRKAGKDARGGHVDVQTSDNEGHDERQRAHVDRQRRANDEQYDQPDDACYFRRHGHDLRASTPSPCNSATNPAPCRRRATSLGTSRPLVSAFGDPV